MTIYQKAISSSIINVIRTALLGDNLNYVKIVILVEYCRYLELFLNLCAAALLFSLPEWKLAWKVLAAFFWLGSKFAPAENWHAWGIIAYAWMIAANFVVDWLLIFIAILLINTIRGRSL